MFEPPHQLNAVYLVGGAVRDKLLGRATVDMDFVVVGETTESMLNAGFLPVGADFPVYLHPTTKEEYALARTERKSGRGYAGFVTDANSTVSLEEDLARRDLTVNSMAMDAKGQLIDPFNGQQDLKNKVLKHTTAAFQEDPVRVLRVARFLARFGPEWKIHPDTQALMQVMRDKGELDYLVAERVWKEMEKALMEKHPHLFFETLCDLGLFPELIAMHNIPQPKQHHPEGDVFIHTMLVLKRAADLDFDLPTRFAALTHDFGKPVAYAQHGKLHGHEKLGVEPIKAFGDRYRVPKKLVNLGCLMAEFHTKCHKITELKAASIQGLIVDSLNAIKQPQRFLQFLQACVCDSQGRGPMLEDREYRQADIAMSYLSALQSLDAKKVVQDAITKGLKGKALGEALRLAQIDCIREIKKTLSQT
ncbi:multifunctional CCA addition/repair protein [Glaciecola sp. MH2013]|uniref:multifunctional CCA addition/repair protein n=1 Tax=Glaciecola sp. MH2013 TaxID=2785524 RepID=UPI00189D3DFD|nr:multifunctional CCA addition/repair protein [Glaciecola sp. MH2013]MBF7073083.1 multifunctional CCA addition/repair protein [Glaciecola sp. MH2013]